MSRQAPTPVQQQAEALATLLKRHGYGGVRRARTYEGLFRTGNVRLDAVMHWLLRSLQPHH